MTVPKHTNFLIVDDFYSIRKAVKVSLTNLGFYGEIFEADSVNRAKELISLKQSEAPVEFIISDLDMPEENGIEFLKFIRSSDHFGHLPFLMLSGVNTKDHILDAISHGVSSYLLKPWDDKSISHKIESCWLKHGSR
jgi:two-component system chemotaxis response regulator CheY